MLWIRIDPGIYEQGSGLTRTPPSGPCNCPAKSLKHEFEFCTKAIGLGWFGRWECLKLRFGEEGMLGREKEEEVAWVLSPGEAGVWSSRVR